MSLRARLIIAFLLLSVVPLGVVTFYSYRANVEAMQDVATREADLLATELSDRMQLVTAQLSERIEHLMEVSQPVVQTLTTTTTAAPAPAPAAAAAQPIAARIAADSAQYNQDVATALGEAAILLNNVQMAPMRGFGRGTPSTGSGRGGTGSSEAGRGSAPGSSQRPTSGSGTRPPTSSQPAFHPVPPPGTPPGVPPGASTAARGPRLQPPPPGTVTLHLGGPTPPGLPAPGASAKPNVVQTDEGTQIDLSQIRRDLYKQILPTGTTENLSPEERQRVAREVNQRMLGIVEGIKLSAIEIQKKADQARVASAATSKKQTAASGAAPNAPAVPNAPDRPSPPPVSTLAPPPVTPAQPSALTPPAAVAAPTQRTAALTGNQLNVRVVRNGEVVRSAQAEINLPNLLMTVFSTMPRELGEVPFAVDKDGKVYAQSDDDKKKVESLGAVATPNGPLGKTVLPAWLVVTTAEPSGSGLRFGIARPIGDSLASLRATAGRNASFGLLLIGLALAGVAPLSTRLTRNLSQLTDGVKRIADGDYRARVDVKGSGEVGALAAAFNQMAEDVERHQRAAVEQERIQRELELGRQIQHDMQPHGALRLGLTEITGVSVSAKEVGGDFFNYFELASGHIAMLVGDVSGKGVGAALLMANIQASLRTRLALGQDLKAVAEEIDVDIEANSPGPLYATLFVGILNPTTRKLRYVNAGHHPQFVLRRDGTIERMSSTGMPVGLLSGYGHAELEIQLEEGDRLFFYTDGCLDAENEQLDMFGAGRLYDVLRSLPPAAQPQDILVHVERAVEQFRGAQELFDDVTVMAVKVG